jgi:hypothetical protein
LSWKAKKTQPAHFAVAQSPKALAAFSRATSRAHPEEPSSKPYPKKQASAPPGRAVVAFRTKVRAARLAGAGAGNVDGTTLDGGPVADAASAAQGRVATNFGHAGHARVPAAVQLAAASSCDIVESAAAHGAGDKKPTLSVWEAEGQEGAAQWFLQSLIVHLLRSNRSNRQHMTSITGLADTAAAYIGAMRITQETAQLLFSHEPVAVAFQRLIGDTGFDPDLCHMAAPGGAGEPAAWPAAGCLEITGTAAGGLVLCTTLLLYPDESPGRFSIEIVPMSEKPVYLCFVPHDCCPRPGRDAAALGGFVVDYPIRGTRGDKLNVVCTLDALKENGCLKLTVNGGTARVVHEFPCNRLHGGLYRAALTLAAAEGRYKAYCVFKRPKSAVANCA